MTGPQWLPDLQAFIHAPKTGVFLFTVMLSLVAACNGETVRDFEVELFDGGQFHLSEQYANNVVVINFWYPSCPPCREEMPEFQDAWEELEEEPVRFLGLFVPVGFDTEHTALGFVKELGLTFQFATDRREAIASAYGIEYFPTTWFIDQGGKLAATHVSALNAEAITATVRDLIDE